MKHKIRMPADYDHACTWCAYPMKAPGYCSIECAGDDLRASNRWGQVQHAKVAREFIRRNIDKVEARS